MPSLLINDLKKTKDPEKVAYVYNNSFPSVTENLNLY
jgi:hypothetical protein